MQLARCPICHSRINLEALIQDEAGRELLALLIDLDTLIGAALVSYLGLFRSPSRDLANDRALRLARETLSLGDPTRLSIALAETVEALRNKQPHKPLTNHNYLKRVLESVEARAIHDCQTLPVVPSNSHQRPVTESVNQRKLSATETAVLAIRSVKFGDDDA